MIQDDYLLDREHFKYGALFSNPELFQKLEIEAKNKLKVKDLMDNVGKDDRKRTVKKFLDYLNKDEGLII